ncbi:hypothetical protein [Citreimonas salinaria]|uniref:Uncharacterized protein n=1 Tax=Citreimonas salinaria TaxID=321339 RepID=A0A1H3KA89_9RHOB|nr:hypothetical protein [Citreimonas salinaria]SDY49071.1 hypothetical protein SAMN05444340_10918 [Citreimonas salinaria]
MLQSMICPGRYVQGRDALSVLDEELARLGRCALAVCDPFVYDNLLESEIRPRLGDRTEIRFERFVVRGTVLPALVGAKQDRPARNRTRPCAGATLPQDPVE